MINRFIYKQVLKSYNKLFKKKEKNYDRVLRSASYYIMRFDGKDMTSRFKPKNEFFNKQFIRSIQEAFFSFCNTHKQQILFGYQCNDEISILIKSIKQDKENCYNRTEKLLSLFASEISIRFDRIYQNIETRFEKKEPINIFDARIFDISKDQIYEYFIMRQAFQIEHMTTRIRHVINKKRISKDECINALNSTGFTADTIYYGCIFMPNIEIAPFDFMEKKDLFKQLLVFE